jgi:hypothetical protein
MKRGELLQLELDLQFMNPRIDEHHTTDRIDRLIDLFDHTQSRGNRGAF